MSREVDAALMQLSAAEGGRCLFVLTVPKEHLDAISRTAGAAWTAAWRRTHRVGDEPALLIIPDDMKLQTLGDAELKAHGLMRIPTGD